MQWHLQAEYLYYKVIHPPTSRFLVMTYHRDKKATLSGVAFIIIIIQIKEELPCRSLQTRR